MTISPSDLFEVGLIVPNLEDAIGLFHTVFGYAFSPIVEGVLPTREGNEDSNPPMRLCVSRTWPQIELLEVAAGTHLTPPAGTGLHHLGYYVDDLVGESKRLADAGIPCVRGGVAGDVFPAGWIYHRMSDGTIIEIVDRDTAPMRQALMEGEVPDSPMVHKVIHLSAALSGAATYEGGAGIASDGGSQSGATPT